MSVEPLGAFPLGTINVGLSASMSAVVPLLAQVDLAITGPFGLGSTASDLTAQLNGAISSQLALTAQLASPIPALMASLASLAQLQASLAATLAFGLPVISLSISASISAAAATSATLGLKVAGLNAVVKSAVAAKLPVLNIVENMQGALSAGSLALLSVGYAGTSTLASAGAQFEALTTAPLSGINPGDQVWGVILLTNVSSVADALSAIMKTS